MMPLPQRWRALRDSAVGAQAIAMSVRLIDLPSRYAFHLIVAAQLGVAAAGGFYIVFSATMLAAGFGRLGVDRALTRAVARAVELGDPGGARAAIGKAFRTVLPVAAAVSGVLLLLSAPVAQHILDKPDLARPLALGAATIIPLTVGVIAGGALAGLHRLGLSLMVYSWLWPALFCVAALVVPLDIGRALLTIAAATALNAAIALVLLYRHLPPAEPPAKAPEPLLRTGIALFSSEVVQLLLGYAPALVLGIVASDGDVGLYALAWRFALAINLLVSTVAAISAPRFAALYARGDRTALERAAGGAVGFVVVLGIVPVIAMLALPREMLGLIGPGFEAAAPTLRWLVAGQVAALLCTGSAELLGMTDHAATLQRINLATLGILVAALSALGSVWGSEGAAIATALTIAGNSAALNLAVRRHLGFVPLFAMLRLRF